MKRIFVFHLFFFLFAQSNMERFRKEKERLEDTLDTLEEENENYKCEMKKLKTQLDKMGKPGNNFLTQHRDD